MKKDTVYAAVQDNAMCEIWEKKGNIRDSNRFSNPVVSSRINDCRSMNLYSVVVKRITD